jgi:hypothetical protein
MAGEKTPRIASLGSWLETCVGDRQEDPMRHATLALVLAAGCAAADPETVTLTIVDLQPDGTFTVDERIITAEEQHALLDTKAGGHVDFAKPIARDTHCDGRSLWLFDDLGFTGNMLCLRGGGTVTLSSFAHHCWFGTRPGCASWSGRVQSLWAGESPGSVVNDAPFPAQKIIDFGVYQKFTKFYDDPELNNIVTVALSY